MTKKKNFCLFQCCDLDLLHRPANVLEPNSSTTTVAATTMTKSDDFRRDGKSPSIHRQSTTSSISATPKTISTTKWAATKTQSMKAVGEGDAFQLRRFCRVRRRWNRRRRWTMILFAMSERKSRIIRWKREEEKCRWRKETKKEPGKRNVSFAQFFKSFCCYSC